MQTDIANEQEIIWLQPKERYPYLRESVSACAQRRALPRRNLPGECHQLVAYAVLKPKAPSGQGWFNRRYWWVKSHDRFQGGDPSLDGYYEPGACPNEAVRTDTIVAGIPALRHACMDDQDAATHQHPALAKGKDASVAKAKLDEKEVLVEVYDLQKPEGEKRWERWMGLAVVKHGVLYVSPRLARVSDAWAPVFCAVDGETIMTFDGITLVRAEWLVRDRPSFGRLRTSMLQHIAACNADQAAGKQDNS